jgi:DNA polymerase-4
LEFLHPLPVERLWGVGPATLARLQRLGITTVGDLADLPAEAVMATVGAAAGRHLHDLSHGRDDREVQPGQGPKSIGHEETFGRDRHDHASLGRELVRFADAVASRLRHGGLVGRTVTLKVRFTDFHTITRSATLPNAVDSGPAIARAARDLLDGVDPAPGVRLLGVSMSGLAPGDVRQLSLDDLDSGSWDQANEAVDEIRGRFGETAIGPASLTGPGGMRLKRKGEAPWGPDE